MIPWIIIILIPFQSLQKVRMMGQKGNLVTRFNHKKRGDLVFWLPINMLLHSICMLQISHRNLLNLISNELLNRHLIWLKDSKHRRALDQACCLVLFKSNKSHRHYNSCPLLKIQAQTNIIKRQFYKFLTIWSMLVIYLEKPKEEIANSSLLAHFNQTMIRTKQMIVYNQNTTQ